MQVNKLNNQKAQGREPLGFSFSSPHGGVWG